MKDILQKEFDKLHTSDGKPSKLTIAEKLMAVLKYLREYRTMESVVADYSIAKGRICEIIRWVEDALAKDKIFKLPGKRVLKDEALPTEYIVV